jgi:hypothetical protein
MNGVLFVEGATAVATSGHMLVTFTSGGDSFRFHLPAHTALKFRQVVMTDAWQVCCAPDAEVVPIRPKSRKRREQ